MAPKSLPEWLAWIETLHPRQMELGLERVHAVLTRMDLRRPPFTVITVAGTNGKGSTVAMCDAILRAAGYKVGAYTSPHLVSYHERVRVDAENVSDEDLCTSFEYIESTRGSTPLTYFEFGTLAALDLFRAHRVEIAVLEVGLGGRLDAVNGVDPDVAVISSIGIDHTAWLGSDRESIGREKAGIFRANRPAICSDPAPPASISATATDVGAQLLLNERDFFAQPKDHGWIFRHRDRVRTGLPYPSMRGDYQLRNAAGAIMALESLGERFPITQQHIREGLLRAIVPGRFQVLPGTPIVVLDVAHNAQAAEALVQTLAQQKVSGRTFAVFGMLVDKAIEDVGRALAPAVDRWFVATLSAARGAHADQLHDALVRAGVVAPIERFDDVASAFAAAKKMAQAIDRIVVFGSFYTVGGILAQSD